MNQDAAQQQIELAWYATMRFLKGSVALRHLLLGLAALSLMLGSSWPPVHRLVCQLQPSNAEYLLWGIAPVLGQATGLPVTFSRIDDDLGMPTEFRSALLDVIESKRDSGLVSEVINTTTIAALDIVWMAKFDFVSLRFVPKGSSPPVPDSSLAFGLGNIFGRYNNTPEADQHRVELRNWLQRIADQNVSVFPRLQADSLTDLVWRRAQGHIRFPLASRLNGVIFFAGSMILLLAIYLQHNLAVGWHDA
ncbi:MAG: hypothetical protein HY975_00185, partial [Candidatus Kerfeldbacteria bacterium]|nr:hypothetical protein [Candidatus Kerfeldbacteria bacterium]